MTDDTALTLFCQRDEGDSLALQCVFEAAAIHDRSFDSGAGKLLDLLKDVAATGGVDIHICPAQPERVDVTV